ncbi:hypothetical protein AB1L88_07940 [Tautonia sp. JC769]|uniref:hypothetical protein n=1 Tax=Tautonia sp. JC769 TaxID=3232135 RepID=UPI00345A8F04
MNPSQVLRTVLDRVIRFGCRHPRRLFLIDGLGALVSAAMLGVVLVRLESVFGVPPRMLLVLAIFPVFFAVYDFACFLLDPRSPGRLLRPIGLANLSYVVIGMILMVRHSDFIMLPGWIYLVSEMLIVAALGFAELQVSRQLTSGRR